VTSEIETAFLAELNANLGIVHRICRVYFPYEPLEREDVLQEIMYQLWKAYPGFQRGSKFSTWMYSVALHTAITHIRRTARDHASEELTESVAVAPSIEDQIDRNEEVAILYAAIATLSDVDKAIALLHLEGHTYEQIASVTGFTITNVSVRLVRLKRALKDHIEKNR
jgi:RNA polymerase sigma factor (sigma-70 family)